MATPDNCDKVIIRDLTLVMSAGIYDSEKTEPQAVIVNVTLEVSPNSGKPLEDIEEVVSYEEIIQNVEGLSKDRHYDLVERFAEDIAQMCLDFDHKIRSADVRVEKPDIIKNAAAVGVQIKRSR